MIDLKKRQAMQRRGIDDSWFSDHKLAPKPVAADTNNPDLKVFDRGRSKIKFTVCSAMEKVFIEFETPEVDMDYYVAITQLEGDPVQPIIEEKTITGFTIRFYPPPEPGNRCEYELRKLRSTEPPSIQLEPRAQHRFIGNTFGNLS